MSRFNPSWVDPELNREWAKWLRPVKNSASKAQCLYCHKTFELSNMGKQAVTSHENGKWHRNVIGSCKATPSITSFLKLNSIQPQVEKPLVEPIDGIKACKGKPPTSMQNSLNFISENSDIKKAEVLWALHMVMSKESFNSQEGICTLFKLMFPDSAIANKIRLSRTKASYLISYGLAPYFHDKLKEEVMASPYLVACFDESLNHISQMEQMDQIVRFWDVRRNQVNTRYWNSLFLGHTTAEDLLLKFKEGFSCVNMHKFLQISMDGPNVNWSFLKKLRDELRECEEDPEILELGSCGLHVVHGAFQYGHRMAKWEVQSFMKGLYNVFKDVPARRADFIRITGTSTFPKHFCNCRWLENAEVAERAIEIFPQVKKFFSQATRLPETVSVENVKKGLKDPFMLAKLHFFVLLASSFETFLRAFQTAKPMLPFLHPVLEEMLRDLLRRFMIPDVLEKAKTAYGLMKIEMKEENFIDIRKVDVGIAVEHELSNLTQSVLQKLQFRRECITFMQFTVAKITDRSPLKYKLVKAVSCLSPSNIIHKPEMCKQLMKTCLETFLAAHHLNALKAEKANVQFAKFLRSVEKISLKTFNMYTDRLDDLFVSLLSGKEEFKDLWEVVKMILILSHGNASVESGFSINKDMITENMQQKSLVSLRIVYDSVTKLGGLLEMKIDDDIIRYARGAYSKFLGAMEEKKAMENEEQRKLLQKRQERKRKAEELKRLTAMKKEMDNKTKDIEWQMKILKKSV